MKKDQKNKTTEENNQQLPQKKYMPLQQSKEYALNVLNQVDARYRKILNHDPHIQRQDTAEAIKFQLQKQKQITRLATAMEYLNNGSFQDKANNYYIGYDLVMYSQQICKNLRKSVYGLYSVQYLAMCITTMQSNLILKDVKYMDYKIGLYSQLARVYQEYDQNVNAMNLINTAVEKVNQVLAIHNYDPPVPTHVLNIINKSLALLKVLLFKYRLTSGSVNVAQWKKKIQEQFANDPQGKAMTIVETMRLKNIKQSNIFEQKKIAWKQQVLLVAYDLYKNDINTICTSLQQEKQKQQKIIQAKALGYLSPEKQVEQIKKRREFQQKMIKMSQRKRASANIPLQYHVEISLHAFEMRNNKIFQQFSKAAMIRIKHRRIQLPYISDVYILYSHNPNANIPNGYQKIPIDLNQINLKIQLNKLRNKKKLPLEDAPPVQQKKKDDKKGSKQKQKQPKQQQDKGLNPTQQQLKLIEHKFIYLLLKKSQYEDKAINDINVVMGHQEYGPQPHKYQGYRKVGIPDLVQYTGVRETTKKIPYVILKHAQKQLRDQQKKTILIDLKPLFSKSPICTPSYGYKKIQVDLRQVPQQLIKNKVHDYIFLTYKTDQFFNINQRQINVLIGIYQLEQSYGRTSTTNVIQDRGVQLQLIYDLGKLANLFQVLKNSLLGTLGQQFYGQRKQFINSLIFHVWKKYIRTQLYQFQQAFQMKLNGEILDHDFQMFKKWIDRAKTIFIEGLKVFELILMQNSQSDLILICKITIQLSKLLEQKKEYKTGIQNLLFCLQRIDQYRNYKLERGVKGNHDLILPWTITANNYKLQTMLQNLKKDFIMQKNQISKLIRIRNRHKLKQQPLQQDQLKEQQFQILESQPVDQIQKQFFQKLFQKKPYNQMDQLVNALHVDLIVNYFRIQLSQIQFQKQQENLKKSLYMSKGATEKGMALAGLEQTYGKVADKTKQKMGVMFGPSETKAKKSRQTLHKTLIEQGKMQPPRPKLHPLQTQLLKNSNKNPYQLSTLYTGLALVNGKSAQQKFLLNQALNYIQQAYKEQQQMIDQAQKWALFVMETGWNGLQEVYKGVGQVCRQVPQKPILLGRSSSWVKLKLPPYIPLINQRDYNQKRLKSQIIGTSLYGKKSAHGVSVSLNSNQLDNTGVKHQIADTVRVNRLEANQKYCFAVAGINAKEQVSIGIGETGQDIGCYHPLPVELIACYLAKVCIQLGQFEQAQKSANIVIQKFCEKSGILDKHLNFQEHSLFYYKLRQELIPLISLIQIKAICDAFVIKARCMKKRFAEDKRKSVEINYQKQNLRILNILFLASKLAPLIPHFPQSLVPLILTTIQSHPNILSPLITLHLLRISNSLQGSLLSSKLTVKIIQKALQSGQVLLARRVSFKIVNKKYYLVGKVAMIEQKKEKQSKKGSKQPKQEPKIVPKFMRELVQSASYSQFLQNVLSSLSDEFGDAVAYHHEKNREALQSYIPYAENSQQIQRMVLDINTKLQYIDMVKDLGSSIGKLQLLKTNPLYLQFLCKVLRRFIQMGQKIPDLTGLPLPSLFQKVKLYNAVCQVERKIIENNIDFYPWGLNELKRLKQQTGQDEYNLSIQLFEQWWNKSKQYKKITQKITLPIEQSSQYQHLYLSQYYLLNSIILLVNQNKSYPYKGQNYFQIQQMSLEEYRKKVKERETIADMFLIDKQLLEKINKVLQGMAKATTHAAAFQGWIAIQNILKTTLNLISHFMLTPFQHKGSNIWVPLSQICYQLLKMLQITHKKGFYSTRIRWQKRIKQNQLGLVKVKLQQDTTKDIPKVTFQEQNLEEFQQQKQQVPQLSAVMTKTFWLDQMPQINLELLGNLFSYTVHVLHLQQKHTLLISLVRQFCNLTNHKFSLSLLPFLLFSLQVLFNKSKQKEETQKGNLQNRKQEYEKMKAQKKSKRQAMLSNEKSKEQIQYQNDVQEIKKKLFVAQLKVQRDTKQVHACQEVIANIKRDTNTLVESAKDLRKNLLQFANQERKMELQEKEEKIGRAQLKKNMMKELAAQYAAIRQDLKDLKTRREPLTEIRNENQSGNLAFASGSSKCEMFWNDALAKIVKEVRPIQRFREIFKSRGNFMVKQVGAVQTLLGINILNKLSYICYYGNLQYQREAILMAGQFGFSLFKTSLPHPQVYINYANYRLRAFSQNQTPFKDQITINMAESLFSLQKLSWSFIDTQNSLYSLPLLTLMQHLSTDLLLSSFYSVNAKLIKAISLAQIGMINQSYQLLLKVFNEKDLPIGWVRQSLYLKKQRGSFWVSNYRYINSLPPYSKQNIQQIQNLLKMDIPKNFSTKYGGINVILLNYARYLLLYVINKQEIFQNAEVNEQRVGYIHRIEIGLRDGLKRIGNIEQGYSRYLGYVTNLSKQNQDNADKYKQMLTLHLKPLLEEQQYNQILPNSLLSSNSLNNPAFYLHLFQQKFGTRDFRLSLICRFRLLLSKCYISINLLTKSYHVLKWGIINYLGYSQGERWLQNGKQKEGGDVVVEKVDPKDKKKDDKKQKKGSKEKPAQDDQKRRQEQLQIIKNLPKLQLKPLNNLSMHLKLMYNLIKVSFRQKRLSQTLFLIGKIKKQCQQGKQKYIRLEVEGIEARVRLMMGNMDAFKVMSQVRSNKALMNYYDQNYVELTGDIAESILQKEGKENTQKAYDLFCHALDTTEILLKEMSFQGIPNDYNKHCIGNREVIDLGLSVEQEQFLKSRKQKAKGGKKQQKKKQVKKGEKKGGKEQQKLQYKVSTLSPVQYYQLSKQNRISYQQVDLNLNSAAVPFNSYLSIVLLYAKVSLRKIKTYILLGYPQDKWSLKQSKNKLLLIDQLLSKCFNVPLSLKLETYYYLGLFAKHTFKVKLQQMVKPYLNNPKYKKYPLHLYRNKDLNHLPPYSLFLKENKPLLEEGKQYLRKGSIILMGQCLLFENDFKVQDLFYSIGEVCLLMAKFTGHVQPKYIQMGEDIEKAKQQSLLYIYNLQLQGQKYLQWGNQAYLYKKQLSQGYAQLGKTAVENVHKLDKDILQEIIQTDYNYKKKYPSGLFDESKKKQTVNSVDLLLFIVKAAKQGRIFTFSNSHLQIQISKIHRFLNANLNSYKQKCILMNLEVAPKKDLSSEYVVSGQITIRRKYNPCQKDYKLIYILGASKRSQIKPQQALEKVGKQIDQGVFHGTVLFFNQIVISADDLDKFLNKCLQLDAKMYESQKKTNAQKQRDFKYWQKQLHALIAQFMGFMVHQVTRKQYEGIIPPVSHQVLQVIIAMMKQGGVSKVHSSLNLILRFFHGVKNQLI